MTDLPKIAIFADAAQLRGGMKEAKGTLFFVHGFPDDENVWNAQVEHFTAIGYDCARARLPHFAGGRAYAAAQGHARFGYSTPQIANALAVALRAHTQEPVTLVCHDWGSSFAMCMQNMHPSLVKNLVSFDVAPPPFGRRVRLKSLPVMLALFVAYQGWLILCWLIATLVPVVGQIIGDTLLRLFVAYVGPLLFGKPPPNATITADACYPYFWLHFRFWTGLFGLRGVDGVATTDGLPSCPTLFAWGSAKGFKLHSIGFEKKLTARGGGADGDGSRVDAIDANHWLQWQRADECNELMATWISDQEKRNKKQK
jgi:pimeloyl-ACP methyl ester carboxylesterase